MRRSRWLKAVLPLAGAAGVTAVVLLGTAGASGAAPGGAPGNNGTVKIHDGADEPAPDVRNEPHVCTFHIHAFFLDPGQVVTFEVQSWPPTGDRTTVLTGTITADDEGEGRDPADTAYSLPDGHYKLFVDTGEGTPIKDKHKVFWVECAPTPTESPTTSPSESPTTSPSESPTTSPSESPTTSPSESPTSPSESPTTSPSESPTTSPSESPTTSPSGTTPAGEVTTAPPTSQVAGVTPPPPPPSGGLPMTGSPALLVAMLGLVLLLAGGGVLLSPWGRRRLLG
jgi:cell division septation protein DedD